jgi:hypothetical protein
MQSASFGETPNEEYTINGAFGSGWHILLCPPFFELPALSALPMAQDGDSIDSFLNQAWIVLHELTHTFEEIVGTLHLI